ncbi:membrane metallo-endopeptidase-like 1 [Pseudomyrmex gracilis]|uniref:membrane metallo-endopeptidase-like 1 n=1 Tax=Pseudomyrmex gracilis TaxID=219809 RepID=UPI0009958658|nr:membrane metallo-endopeptidase-like 1 [Pseudomyrmex gracilis]
MILKLYLQINWLEIIQSVFASKRIAIEPSEELVVQAYNYLIYLGPLLDRTPSRTIVNHMIWNSIQWFYFRYIKKSELINTGIDDWWKTCITQSNLKHAILHEYVKKYISNDTIQDITKIIRNVRETIYEQIENSTWIDEPTKTSLIKTLMYIKHEFIMPDWYSDEAIDRYYEGMNVSTNYLETAINFFQFERKKMMQSLRISDITLEWDVQLTSIQAYYNPVLHRIVLPATLLQNPIYDKTRLSFMNYAALGSIIGHRINYVFVDNNLKFTDYKSLSLLMQQRIIEYIRITQCFIDQYDKDLFPELDNFTDINRVETCKQTIAESAAIATAYYAYKNRQMSLNDFEWRLQGLQQYTDDQIFFITYAQMMCEYIPSERINMHIEDVYVPHEIKILGALSNFPAFSAAYNCSVKKPMNPERKYALW